MRANLIVLIFLAGVTVVALGRASDTEEPIQPVLRLNMNEIDLWRGQWDFHRSADGELVLIGSGGPDGSAIASKDEGRTWHDWPDIHTWPAVGITAIARRGKDLFIHGPDAPDLRVYHSQDEGKTWSSGHRLMQWPKLVAIPNGPHQGRALLWSTPGDRILVTQEGHLVLPVFFLLGVEGLGPELIGTMISEDDGVTWRCYELFGPPQGYRDRPEGFGEPKIVELADGRIWMVFRTCLGHLWQAFSTDGGRTWGQPSSTGLVAPAAPLNAQRIPGTNSVVVVWDNAKPKPTTQWKVEHNFWFPRRPMVFAVSHDNCKTWSRPVIITENIGYMRNIYFSDKEMFIFYKDGTGTKQWPRVDYRDTLVIYDLKTVLALQPEK